MQLRAATKPSEIFSHRLHKFHKWEPVPRFPRSICEICAICGEKRLETISLKDRAALPRYVAVKMGTDEYLHRELTKDIAGAAMTVLNVLKPGLKEKAYENALAIELRKHGHVIEQQRGFDVHYDGIIVDTLIPDLIVDDKVIVDPKCVAGFTDTHFAQMIGYLAVTGHRVALLLNFHDATLRWKRVIR